MYDLPQKKGFVIEAPLRFGDEKRVYEAIILFPRLIKVAYKIEEALDEGFELSNRSMSDRIPIVAFKREQDNVYRAEYQFRNSQLRRSRFSLRRADAISIDGKFEFNREGFPECFSFKGLLFVKSKDSPLLKPKTEESAN